MKAINITELQDRFKAALDYEQSEYERSPMFGEDGNFDTGYSRGLWKAYSIFVDTEYFYMKEYIDKGMEALEEHLDQVEKKIQEAENNEAHNN